MELKTGDKINISFKDSGKVLLREVEILDVYFEDSVPADDVEYGWNVRAFEPALGKVVGFCEQGWTFELVEAAPVAIVEAVTPAESAIETAPRELNAFEKLLAGAKFQTVAEVAPEAIERAAKIREIEKQAALVAERFAGKVVAEKDAAELAWINTEYLLVRRAYHDAYEAEYARLMKKAGL